MVMERVGDRWEKMEGYCSTGQSPQRAVVPMEEEVWGKRPPLVNTLMDLRVSTKCGEFFEMLRKYLLEGLVSWIVNYLVG
jgi:hypothetical protein